MKAPTRMSWLPLTGRASSRSRSTRCVHVLSMPRLMLTGFAPLVTACGDVTDAMSHMALQTWRIVASSVHGAALNAGWASPLLNDCSGAKHSMLECLRSDSTVCSGCKMVHNSPCQLARAPAHAPPHLETVVDDLPRQD